MATNNTARTPVVLMSLRSMAPHSLWRDIPACALLLGAICAFEPTSGIVAADASPQLGPLPGGVTAAELYWHAAHPRVTPRKLEFTSMRDKVAAGHIQLSNGEKITDSSLWSAVVIADLGNGEFCTATFIGPHVLLTAAHCVDALNVGDPTSTIGGTITLNGRPPIHVTGCKMSHTYEKASIPTEDKPRSSEDFALCDIPESLNDIILETLPKGASPSQGNPILMTGYGCINIRVENSTITFDDGKDILRVGDAAINATGVLDSSSAAGAYIRARAVHSEPVLCPGDSGGPVFTSATKAHQEGPHRRIVAVNSKVTAVPSGTGYVFLSFMASTATPAFQQLLTDWVAASSAKRHICGFDIDPGLSNCRA